MPPQPSATSWAWTDALRLATRRALDTLAADPDRVLLDGSFNFVDWRPSEAIVEGDRRCLSIAAASIMAKVVRDRIMAGLAPEFPPYRVRVKQGLSRTRSSDGLATHGPVAPLHRLSWSFAPTPLPDAEPVPRADHRDTESALAAYARALAGPETTLF